MTTRNGRVIGKDVCIVGTGMVGLAAIKNLKEQGLKPTAFTKDDAVGCLWKPKSDVTKLTALDQTSFNTSKQCVGSPGPAGDHQTRKLIASRMPSPTSRCLTVSFRP